MRVVDEGLLGADIDAEGLALPGFEVTECTAQAAVGAQLTARVERQRHQPARQAVFEAHVEHGFITAGVAQLVAQQENVVRSNGLALDLLPGADFRCAQVGKLDRLGRDPERGQQREQHDRHDDKDRGQRHAKGQPAFPAAQPSGAVHHGSIAHRW